MLLILLATRSTLASFVRSVGGMSPRPIDAPREESRTVHDCSSDALPPRSTSQCQILRAPAVGVHAWDQQRQEWSTAPTWPKQAPLRWRPSPRSPSRKSPWRSPPCMPLALERDDTVPLSSCGAPAAFPGPPAAQHTSRQQGLHLAGVDTRQRTKEERRRTSTA